MGVRELLSDKPDRRRELEDTWIGTLGKRMGQATLKELDLYQDNRATPTPIRNLIKEYLALPVIAAQLERELG